MRNKIISYVLVTSLGLYSLALYAAPKTVGLYCTSTTSATMTKTDMNLCDDPDAGALLALTKYENDPVYGNYTVTKHDYLLNRITPATLTNAEIVEMNSYDAIVVVSGYNPINDSAWAAIRGYAQLKDKPRSIVLFTDACDPCSSGSISNPGNYGQYVTAKVAQLINDLNPDTHITVGAMDTVVTGALNPHTSFNGDIYNLMEGTDIEYGYFNTFDHVPLGNILAFTTPTVPPSTTITDAAGTLILPRAQSISSTCIIATVDANPIGVNLGIYGYNDKHHMIGALMAGALNDTGGCAYVPKIEFKKTVSDQNGDGYAALGEKLTYTITYKNTDTVTQNSIAISDDIPVGTTYVPGSATITLPTGTLTSGFAPSETTDARGTVTQVIWGPTSQLASGDTITATFQVTVSNVFTGLAQYTNFALDNMGNKSNKVSTPLLRIDHYQLDFNSTALTCNDQSITVTACPDATCSVPVDATFNMILSPDSNANIDGQWVNYANCGSDTNCQALVANTHTSTTNANITFTHGKAKIGLRRFKTGIATIGITSSDGVNLAATGMPPYECHPDGSATAGSCDIAFNDAGFIFKPAIPNGVSNKPLKGLQFFAMKNDSTLDPLTTDQSNRCVPRFVNISEPIGFWHDYVNPATGTMQLQLAAMKQDGSFDNDIDATNATFNVATNETDAMNAQRTVYFDSTGMATINLRYPDAGQIDLNLKYVGIAGAPDAGLVVQSVTPPFIFRPYGLYITRNTPFHCSPADLSSAALFSSCGQTQTYFAGTPFNLTITPKAWVSDSPIAAINLEAAGSLTRAEARQFNNELSANPITPNFILNNIPLNVHLLAPTSGINGQLHPGIYNANGGTVATTSIDEAGIFEINVGGTSASTLIGFTYLDDTVVIPTSLSAPLGVFIPDYFKVTTNTAIDVHSLFTYMDEPGITASYEVHAYSALDTATHNYRLFDASWLSNFIVQLADPNKSITDETNTMHLNRTVVGITSVTSQWETTAGAEDIYKGDVSGISYQRRTANSTGYTVGNSATYTDGPYDLSPVLRHNTGTPSIPFKNSGATAPLIEPVFSNTTNKVNLRFGIMSTPHDVHALTGKQARIPFTANYWNGTKFIPNADDNDSLIYPSSIGAISQCRDQITTGNVMVPTHIQVNNGFGELRISPPTRSEKPTTYWFAMDKAVASLLPTCVIPTDKTNLRTTSQEWLKFNWDASKPTQYIDPSTIVQFGSGSGKDRKIIYRTTR